jgi:chromosome segregation ATPase
VIDDLLQQALAAAGPSRRDRVIAVAEVWHRHHGVLPSIKEARDFVGRGSYGDVQRDLKDFAKIIASRTQRAAPIPGLPRDLELKVGEVIAGLWQTIYEKAQGEFAADRQVLDTQLTTLSGKLDGSEKDRHQALEDRSNALQRLSEVERQLVAANDSVAAELHNVSERNITITQLQSRIGEMETEKVRLQADHATELRALQAQLKERENRVLDLHAAAETIKAGYEGQLQAAHTLETEHRIRADKAETARQKIQETLEATANDLANLRGQFEGRAGRLATLEADRDQAISRIALLERDLDSVTSKFSAAVEQNASLSHQVATLSDAVEQRQAAIEALQSNVAALAPMLDLAPKKSPP